MSEDSIDPAVIKKTQETLGKFVKKPALTEKLLKKPPFRFLHDIVNVVIKDTRLFQGLFNTTELNSENIKDREGKIRFLQKLIDATKLTTGENLTARPSKIVAGHEPEKTNELLQLIGIAIDKKLDSTKAIESIKNEAAPKQKEVSSKKKVDATKTIKPPNKSEKVGSKIEKPEKKEKIKSKEKENDKPKKDGTKTTVEKTSKKAKGDTKMGETVKTKQKIEKPEEPPQSQIKVPKKAENEVAVVKDVEIGVMSKEEKPIERKKSSSSIKSDSIKRASSLEKKISLEKLRPPEVKPLSETIDDDLPTPTILAMNGETEPKKSELIAVIDQEAEIRQSQPRRKSSGQRRKSVEAENLINNVNSAENERPKNNSAKMNRLKHENSSEQQPKIAEAAAKQPAIQLPTSTPNSTTAATAAQQKPSAPVEPMKRQSTFVRENSELDRPKTSLRPPSVRPPSARPGAPRRRDKNVEIILQPNEQVKMAGINVKVENFNTDLEDDGENLVIIETTNTIQDIDQSTADSRSDTIENDENLQQGHLVQQILKTQKELTHADKESGADQEWDSTHKRQTSAKQMDSLRDAIQILTRSVNPLGKLMDFLPEDMDSMQLELTMWKDAFIQASAELKKEKNLTESAIEPMKNQLIQINANIREYSEMIDASRAKILQNNEKIIKLLTEQ